MPSPPLDLPPLNTHLVPVLRVHIEGVHQVTCHLIVTGLGCPVQHDVGVLCLLVDSFPKHRQQGLDHLNVPAYCSKVHGIEAILRTLRNQIQIKRTLYVQRKHFSAIDNCIKQIGVNTMQSIRVARNFITSNKFCKK